MLSSQCSQCKIASIKNSTEQGQSQRSASVYVPINVAFRNQTFGEVWRSKDQALTKVSVVQTYAETLDRSAPKIPSCCSTHVRKMPPKVIEPIKHKREVCDELMMK